MLASQGIRNTLNNAPDAADPYIALGGYYIDRGNVYFNEGQETFEQAAYEALMEKYETMCISALTELEKAFSLMPEDAGFKKDIANTIKSICFVLRNKDAQYQQKFDEYNAYINQ